MADPGFQKFQRGHRPMNPRWTAANQSRGLPPLHQGIQVGQQDVNPGIRGWLAGAGVLITPVASTAREDPESTTAQPVSPTLASRDSRTPLLCRPGATRKPPAPRVSAPSCGSPARLESMCRRAQPAQAVRIDLVPRPGIVQRARAIPWFQEHDFRDWGSLV